MSPHGPFVSAEEAKTDEAIARLAAVQTKVKALETELEELLASMSLDKVDVDKHLEYVEGRIHALHKEIVQVERLGRTPTPPNPDSSGGSED